MSLLSWQKYKIVKWAAREKIQHNTSISWHLLFTHKKLKSNLFQTWNSLKGVNYIDFGILVGKNLKRSNPVHRYRVSGDTVVEEESDPCQTDPITSSETISTSLQSSNLADIISNSEQQPKTIPSCFDPVEMLTHTSFPNKNDPTLLATDVASNRFVIENNGAFQFKCPIVSYGPLVHSYPVPVRCRQYKVWDLSWATFRLASQRYILIVHSCLSLSEEHRTVAFHRIVR